MDPMLRLPGTTDVVDWNASMHQTKPNDGLFVGGTYQTVRSSYPVQDAPGAHFDVAAQTGRGVMRTGDIWIGMAVKVCAGNGANLAAGDYVSSATN